MEIKLTIARVWLYLYRFFKKFKPMPSIVAPKLGGFKKIQHISAFNYGNAGDIVLPIVLQDLLNENISVNKWDNLHVSKSVDQKIVDKINQNDMMVIGGGGLFLRDTNANIKSGWQWSCDVENLRRINVPIVMFAVGYNRFRGQEDFDPIFTENLNEFVKKASFIGIRNYGSINKIRPYLHSQELREKLTFQPCMTTIISNIYPDLTDYSQKEDFVAFNCAFDREKLRINDDSLYYSIARVAKRISEITKVKYYSHMLTDNKILDFFDELNVPYELVEFKSPVNMLVEYAKPKLVIGMRGHAQMIPFGCNTPILSIISHDKLGYFLDDINHPEWGVDVLDKNFEKLLLQKSIDFYNNYSNHMEAVNEEQLKLLKITEYNLEKISKFL